MSKNPIAFERCVLYMCLCVCMLKVKEAFWSTPPARQRWWTKS